jgi:hypothetical protein
MAMKRMERKMRTDSHKPICEKMMPGRGRLKLNADDKKYSMNIRKITKGMRESEMERNFFIVAAFSLCNAG